MDISVIPRATEKAYGLSGANTYVFSVPLSANKQQIAEAIETQFDVEISSIRTLVQSGKAVRYSRGKHRYPGTTNRKDTKKAYVTVSKGSIKVFDEPETPTSDKEKK